MDVASNTVYVCGMVSMRMRGWLVLGSVALAMGWARAQDVVAAPMVVQPMQAAPVGSGTVTGRVLAQDTQQPARFVMVMLQSVAAVNGDDEGGRGFGGGGVSARTDAEGEFTATNVAPGDYYVTAGAPGYISERALLQAGVSAGADVASLLAGIAQVHVDVAGTSSVTVTMERGGTISGKVQWEDGSPAAGVSVSAVAATGITPVQLPDVLQRIASPGGSGNFATTDDRGMFRVLGLPTGEYVVQTVIQAPTQTGGLGRGMQMSSPIRVFSPGVFHKADAKPVTVKAGEERSDVRMVIDLRALRTVSGHVGSSASGQSVASGRVTLADPNDAGLQLFGSITPNGDFAVRYVPAGNYTLQVSGASTQSNGGGRGRGGQTGGVSFQPFSQAEVVGDTDVSGVGITLTPVATPP